MTTIEGTTAHARRRFTLLDAMILVAATACGLGVDGGLAAIIRRQEGMDALDVLGSMFGARRYPEAAAFAMLLVLPVVAALTLAMVPLRLIRPRPGFRRLARQPGWVASCAFAVALVFSLVSIGGFIAVIEWNHSGLSFVLVEVSPLAPLLFAPAILAAWLGLILGRRWRAEPSWVDRAGRALGMFWVAASVVGTVVLGMAFL